MQKKLTLEQTWKYCLAMWKWIDEEIRNGSAHNAAALKREWMNKHPHFGRIVADCFFCLYATEHYKSEDDACSHCPGKLVSKRFHCENKTYDYYYKPIKFYQKLVELNEKRKAALKRK